MKGDPLVSMFDNDGLVVSASSGQACSFSAQSVEASDPMDACTFDIRTLLGTDAGGNVIPNGVSFSLTINGVAAEYELVQYYGYYRPPGEAAVFLSSPGLHGIMNISFTQSVPGRWSIISTDATCSFDLQISDLNTIDVKIVFTLPRVARYADPARMSGLCGNCNQQSDDYRTADGNPVSGPGTFAAISQSQCHTA